MKFPWCKFFPRDWMGDSELRSLSYAARGLWADMLCLMRMSSERPGFLIMAGKAMKADELARLTNGSPREVKLLLKQIEDAGLFSRTEEGVIFSRRLVRDAEISGVRSAAGKRGGNPFLVKQKDKQKSAPGAGVLKKPRSQKPEANTSKRERAGRGGPEGKAATKNNVPWANGHKPTD